MKELNEKLEERLSKTRELMHKQQVRNELLLKMSRKQLEEANDGGIL